GVLLVHFVNTDRSNKVVIYFESSSICVSPGFGGLTGISAAVRPAALRRSDRRCKGGQTGGGDSKRQLIRQSYRWLSDVQTGTTTSVRSRSIDFEGNFYCR
ncbi:Os05g0504800, partial [Oryza sativa Japonica Group]